MGSHTKINSRRCLVSHFELRLLGLWYFHSATLCWQRESRNQCHHFDVLMKKNQVISCHWKFALIGKTSVFFVKLLHQLLLLLILIIRWSCLYYEEKLYFLSFFENTKKTFLFFLKIVPLPHYFRLVKKPEKTSQETITSPFQTAKYYYASKNNWKIITIW